MFLNSAAVPDVSCNPNEDDEDEFEACDIDKDRSDIKGCCSRFDENDDNNNERDQEVYSLDDSFIKMIDNTYITSLWS